MTSGIPALPDTSADNSKAALSRDRNFREDLGTQLLWTAAPTLHKRVMAYAGLFRTFGQGC